MAVEQPTLETLLDESAATDAFKQAVQSFEKGQECERIAHNPDAPNVKVLRVICQLLETRRDLPIDAVQVDAQSGCSDFVGELVVQPGGERFEFVWDCKWRAEQEGWVDPLGLPDQIRAAREFGYRCFQKFESL